MKKLEDFMDIPTHYGLHLVDVAAVKDRIAQTWEASDKKTRADIAQELRRRGHAVAIEHVYRDLADLIEKGLL